MQYSYSENSKAVPVTVITSPDLDASDMEDLYC